jgi:hypothetical protein
MDSSPTLPPELWRHVLAYATTHGDDEAACRAVCRDWRALTGEVAVKRRAEWLRLAAKLRLDLPRRGLLGSLIIFYSYYHPDHTIKMAAKMFRLRMEGNCHWFLQHIA